MGEVKKVRDIMQRARQKYLEIELAFVALFVFIFFVIPFVRQMISA